MPAFEYRDDQYALTLNRAQLDKVIDTVRLP
jgi:hypothetical protein